jgi:hypothetical protein
MKTIILISILILTFGCASTKSISYHGTVKIRILNSNDTSEIFQKQQCRLDTILIKAAKKNNSIVAISHNDSNRASFNINVYIDSIILISYEIQREKLSIKDSINNEVKKRQDHFDSTANPLTEQQKVIGSAVGTLAMNALLFPIGMAGFMVISDEPRPTTSYTEGQIIKKILLKPKIKGKIIITENTDSQIIWKKVFEIDDEYDRFVSYEEQVEMLLRILVRNLRFEYKTPFLWEKI